jgi:hypothetical protein
MEGNLLGMLGGSSSRSTRPPMRLEALDDRVRYLQVNAIENSTTKGYATGARNYITFCMAHGLPLDPTPSTLARYIAYTSQFIASGPKYLTGARHFLRQLYPEFDESRKHPLVQAVIAGSRKTRADPVRRKAPLSTDHLLAFAEIAQVSGKYDDVLFATILTCGFYACHRVGKLVWPNSKDLRDWRKVIKRGTLQLTPTRAGYHLPYHKADRFYMGTDILLTTQDVADPVTQLHTYVAIRDTLHGARAALFLCEDGSIPTRGWFDRKFFTLLDRSFGGHSLRAGGATFYAREGLSEDIIQALGRWSSEAWKGYICDHPTVRAEAQLAALRLRR